jgi:hypothetical protein
MKWLLFSMIAVGVSFSVLAQDGVKAKNSWEEVSSAFADQPGMEPNAENAYRSFSMPSGFFTEVALEWECLGPNTQPIENNPGGKAIPSYSTNRGNGTGRINFLYVDPDNEDRVFACSPSGGLFVTEDAGANWRNAGTDQLPISGVSSVTVNPQDPNNWIIATGDSDDRFMFSDGIWRTFDAGETWENINGSKSSKSIPISERNSKWLFVGQVAAHPCDFNRVFVACNYGLYMTDNALDEVANVKWERVAPGSFYDIEIIPWNESVVLVGGDDFYWSRNCGNDWEKLPNPEYKKPEEFKFMRLSLELSEKDPDAVYAAVSNATKFSNAKEGEATLQRFDLKTKKWEFIRSLKASMNNVIPTRGRAFAISPQDANLILVGNVQPVFRSEDGGRSFTRIERGQMHDDIHHLEFQQNGTTVWASHDGGVSVSYDKGLTWQARDHGIGAANVFGVSVAQSENLQLLYGGFDTGGNLLRDGQWSHVTWGDGFETIIDFSDPDVMFATKQNGYINRTMDGGKDFDKSVSCSKTKTQWHSWIRQNLGYSNIIYCAGDKLVRSSSYGEDWEVILDSRELEGEFDNVSKFVLSQNHPDVMYAYVISVDKIHPVIAKSENINDDAENIRWEIIETPEEGWISGLAIDPDDPDKIWMSYKNYSDEGKMFRYTGTRWIDIGKKLGYAVVESLVVDPNSEERLYAGSNYGVFTRNKLEDNWILLTGLPGTYIKSLDINQVTRKLIVGTYGRGIWQTDLYPD